jgi:chemotaxis signal transduction protein
VQEACNLVAEKAPSMNTQDTAEEVSNFAATDIEEAPHFGSGVTTESIVGLAKIKGLVISLMDLDKLVSNPRTAKSASVKQVSPEPQL